MPSFEPTYVNKVPEVPVSRFQREILEQLRRTAAFGVIFLVREKALGGANSEFRHRLVKIVEQFKDSEEKDPHWECYAAQAYSSHSDGDYASAERHYGNAIGTIKNDRNGLYMRDAWKQRVVQLEKLQGQAKRRQGLEPTMTCILQGGTGPVGPNGGSK
jgi:hypothetical protein